jgi:putative membrane protein
VRVIGAVLANAMALLATTVVPGIQFDGSWLTLLLAGALFGLFNLFVRPVALLLSLPFLILTLGLFYFLLNGLLLLVASWFLPGYSVSGVLSGILGGFVVAIVNWALATLFGDKGKGPAGTNRRRGAWR